MSKILEEKLNIAKLLVNPSLMNKTSEFKKFSLHGLVLKYLAIYSTYRHPKKIEHTIEGENYLEIFAHPDAVSVIPHTFIDNAIKYSPIGGQILVHIQDAQDHIEFFVSSYGPRIHRHEKQKIFGAFYRGEAAKQQEEEGSGYGLYVSQLVAENHLGTEIKVSQEPILSPNLGYRTTFSIDFPLKAIFHS